MDPHLSSAPRHYPELLGIWEGDYNPGRFGTPQKNSRRLVINILCSHFTAKETEAEMVMQQHEDQPELCGFDPPPP